MFANNTVYFLLLIFSGANIPLETLPSLIQNISYALPLTRGIAAAREIIAGSSFASISNLLTGELLIGVVYTILGYALYRAFEFEAKRRGTLEVI